MRSQFSVVSAEPGQRRRMRWKRAPWRMPKFRWSSKLCNPVSWHLLGWDAGDVCIRQEGAGHHDSQESTLSGV